MIYMRVGRLPTVLCLLLLSSSSSAASSSSSSSSDPLARAIYTYQPYTACKTFFNATQRVGCHAAKGGVSAAVFSVKSARDVQTYNALTSPVVALTPAAALSNALARALRDAPPAAWIVTHLDGAGGNGGGGGGNGGETTLLPELAFSPARASRWLAEGTSLRWDALGFPVAFVASAAASAELDAKARWNAARGAFDDVNAEVARLDPYVGPERMDVAGCLALKKCSTLAGFSMWSTVGPTDAVRDKVWAVAQLDALSLNDGRAIGANAAASGMIALLAAAATFNRSTSAAGYRRQISFALFDGESFGQMGSRRFVRDVRRWDCAGGAETTSGYKVCADSAREKYHKYVSPSSYAVPARFGHLNKTAAFVLAIDHVGRVGNGTSNMYMHGARSSSSSSGSQKGGAAAGLASAAYGAGAMPLQAGARSPAGPLPPSPADAFVGSDASPHSSSSSSSSLIPEGVDRAAVLSGYSADIGEVNPYYQSMFDVGANLDVDAITRAATTAARALYALATVADIDNATAIASAVASPQAQALAADRFLVASLVNCSTVSWDCPLAVDYLGTLVSSYKKNNPGALYPNKRLSMLGDSPSPQVLVVRELLAAVTAEPSQVGPACVSGSDNLPICRINVTGQECIRRQCTVPNAWFHWAFPVSLAQDQWTVGKSILFKIKVPGTSSMAIQSFRRVDVGVEGLMLGVGTLVVGVAVALGLRIGKSKWLDELGEI